MTDQDRRARREAYTPGRADAARVEKDGETWQLVVVRQLRHAPEAVWEALTDPAQLREWAPFDADKSLSTAGRPVTLTTVGAPSAYASETIVTRADAPHLLIYDWGGNQMRWELEAVGSGTKLTLWTSIDRKYIAMGAAGWHICFDVLEHWLDGEPLGRIAGVETLKFDGWQRLHAEYAKAFGLGASTQPPGSAPPS